MRNTKKAIKKQIGTILLFKLLKLKYPKSINHAKITNHNSMFPPIKAQIKIKIAKIIVDKATALPLSFLTIYTIPLLFIYFIYFHAERSARTNFLYATGLIERSHIKLLYFISNHKASLLF